MVRPLDFSLPVTSASWQFWLQNASLVLANRSDSGLGQTLPQVVFGRLIAGVGGAGINCLVSIVVAGKQKDFIHHIPSTVLCLIRDRYGPNARSSILEELCQHRCDNRQKPWRTNWGLSYGHYWVAMVIHPHNINFLGANDDG